MSKIIVVDPFDYVVVGGTGDLAKRKLLRQKLLCIKLKLFGKLYIAKEPP